MTSNFNGASDLDFVIVMRTIGVLAVRNQAKDSEKVGNNNEEFDRESRWTL
jgi:hypothetical protein